jgi:hypothetical protein
MRVGLIFGVMLLMSCGGTSPPRGVQNLRTPSYSADYGFGFSRIVYALDGDGILWTQGSCRGCGPDQPSPMTLVRTMTDSERARVEAAFRSLPSGQTGCSETLDSDHKEYGLTFRNTAGQSTGWAGCMKNGALAEPYAEAARSLGL